MTSENKSGKSAAVDSALTTFDSKTFLKNVTEKAGVYVMLNTAAEVLYVGKAKNLRNRLSSYFRASGLTNKTIALVSRIQQIEVTVTATEREALLLEQNLIKQYKPPYNILLRDDKSYPYIYLSTDHKHPRLSIHRGSKKGKGMYFGPYPSASAVRESLSWLQKVFRVRQCEDSYYRGRSRPCLQYQIGRCSGPCVNAVSDQEYALDVEYTKLFLQGKSDDVSRQLADEMERCANALEFEQAAEIRDRIGHLQQVQASQCIEGETGDIDIVAGAMDAAVVCVQLLCVRGGRVLGSRSYFPKSQLEESLVSQIEAFVAQHYLIGTGAVDMPREIITNIPLDEASLLAAGLSEQAGRQVSISHNVRSHRAKWLSLAITAAEQNLANRLASSASSLKRFKALQDALGLENKPERMECFDISHSSGEATVASCVVFDGNGPLKSDYRKMNIDGIAAGDDYAAMHQALSRRYKRVKAGDIVMPDILFIDGGKGQLTQAKQVMDELGIDGLLMVGVAKGSDRRAGLEVLIRGDTGQEISLPDNSPALHLVQHIRDESHRFAITGHKARRDKARRQSTLESIPGVGAKRRRELLRHFGGLQGVRQASVEDLRRVSGISEKIAQQIHEGLRSA
ncbi:UvrABC system protein C [Zhongshania aliphaticivorans]|uniref:UvrABC system protein C n=1 Tax=Zhongshania aliphaticivorans TaxID=1470434 RepID=A0A5S9QN25_9GAMM|nr:excinuclease ABC subunit UvrC [Zhongshania aliphaticivorans]CAA0088445.1 UvrABC system protein C [Zhongshania aliphaticivorans]CAA0120529.1 UvrABC system protein C [Zhongshania aliphaticivorans]